MGGGISIGLNSNDSLAILINNTITANEGEKGGGLYLMNADAVVINSILWEDEAVEEGDEIFVLLSNLEVRHSNIHGDEIWPGGGNMNIDPEFKEDGYHLLWTSMLINQGIDSIEIGNEWYACPINDIDNESRPNGGVDIGADEWYPSTGTLEIEEVIVDLLIFPNPFTTSTTITYTLSDPYAVTISIFNHQGQLIGKIEEKQPEGEQRVQWNPEGLPAGMYYFRIQAGVQNGSGKLIILR